MKIKVGDLRHIEDLYLKGEISYSKQVEMLNEIANQPDTHYVESILPTEEDFRRALFHKNEAPQESENRPTYRAGLIDGYFSTIRLIKSRLAGKEEQK